MTYVGEIRMFGGMYAPAGWAFCNGQLLSIAEYNDLFNLVGTTYGGDGETTFAVPDLRSRFPMHSGNGYILGETGGVETVTLTTNQMPGHGHTPIAAAIARSGDPQGRFWANWGDAPFSSEWPSTAMASNALEPVGGGQPHNNMPPYLGMNFIISLHGVFPAP